MRWNVRTAVGAFLSLSVWRLLALKFPHDPINHGFDLMHEGKSIRAVVEF